MKSKKKKEPLRVICKICKRKRVEHKRIYLVGNDVYVCGPECHNEFRIEIDGE